MDTDSALRRLLDEQAVHDVTLRYAFCLDARDWDGVAATFTEDAWIDYQDLPPGSRDDFLPVLRAAMDQFDTTQHLLTRQLVEWETDDRVRARAYAIAYHRLSDGDGGLVDLVAGVLYDDLLDRRDEGWRVTRRTVITPWLRQDPVASFAPMVPEL